MIINSEQNIKKVSSWLEAEVSINTETYLSQIKS